jgi:hypothetical protein
MATVSLSPHPDLETRYNEDAFVEWKRCFSAAERRKLIDEDLLAGRSVPLVLAAIVGIGLILAVVSVWLTS